MDIMVCFDLGDYITWCCYTVALWTFLPQDFFAFSNMAHIAEEYMNFEMGKPNFAGFVVIGAGLPRTGTMSTRAALMHLLDGACYHMLQVGNVIDIDHGSYLRLQMFRSHLVNPSMWHSGTRLSNANHPLENGRTSWRGEGFGLA